MDEIPPYLQADLPGAVSRLADRYLLRRQIGFGGAAEVFEAWDGKLERAVAIKLFRSDVPGLDDAHRHRIEMRILAKLNHPALVAIYDAGTEHRPDGPSRPYLVMELVDGPSLAQQLAAGPLTEGDTARLAIRLAGALTHIHHQGIVHRDVKPANVLLDKRSPALAKLTDFGIARSTDDARLTGAGLTIGTAQYLSPEQALGATVGPASDVYSLGLLLLECRTGRPAFAGTPIESALARLHRDPDIPEDLGPVLGPLLTAMTAREPQDRPTAAEVALGVAELAGTTAELPIVSVWTPVAGGAATALLPPIADEGPVIGLDAAESADSAPGVLAGEPLSQLRPGRPSTLLAAAVGTILIGTAAVAIGMPRPGSHRSSPPALAQPSTSSTPAPTRRPATKPVALTTTARPRPPSSSHPVQVVVATPEPPPKGKKGHPKHGH
jgi:eukaryotic-like serine/threonine-protein kinase